MSGEDDDFDKMMKELDGETAAPVAPAPAPARRGRKPQTMVETAPAPVTQQVTPPGETPPPAPPEEPVFVKIAGMEPEPQSVTVTVVENAEPPKAYLSPQTLAEIEAGRQHLQRFK